MSAHVLVRGFREIAHLPRPPEGFGCRVRITELMVKEPQVERGEAVALVDAAANFDSHLGVMSLVDWFARLRTLGAVRMKPLVGRQSRSWNFEDRTGDR